MEFSLMDRLKLNASSIKTCSLCRVEVAKFPNIFFPKDIEKFGGINGKFRGVPYSLCIQCITLEDHEERIAKKIFDLHKVLIKNYGETILNTCALCNKPTDGNRYVGATNFDPLQKNYGAFL